MSKVSASDLERQIYEKEEIKVVLRCKKNSSFDSYDYKRKAAANTSVKEWAETRLRPIIGDDTEFEIVNGAGQSPHGRTNIETVRNSYHED